MFCFFAWLIWRCCGTQQESTFDAISCYLQVLECSLEAHILRSDNSALAKDCRSEIKAANARLLKLTRKVALPYLPKILKQGDPMLSS